MLPPFSYTLSCYPTGTPVCEDEVFSDLDRARDIAFELALEYGATIRITEHFGASSNLIEEVTA